MFNIGEKVVCINNGVLKLVDDGIIIATKESTNKLKNGNIYTVVDSSIVIDGVILNGIPGIFFDFRRFTTLIEYRKQKLEKLNKQKI